MNILIIDDHPLARHGLASLLAGSRSDLVATCAHSHTHAHTQLAGDTPPDWLVLGLHAPCDLQCEFYRSLCGSSWMSRTVLWTAEATHPLLQPALDAGARGVIPKTASLMDTLAGLTAVFQGEVHVPARLIPPLRPTAAGTGPRTLSPRLRDVLSCLLRGTPNKVIARELGISDYTVKEYVSAVLAHHGVANRLELVLKIQTTASASQPTWAGLPDTPASPWTM